MRALKSLGLPFSQEALQDALSLIQEKLSFYRAQPLKGDWFCVFIDGYRAKLRTEDGKLKEILGFWIFPGKETKKAWAEVFQDLVNRGVKRVLVFVTDDFPGVEELIGKLFPFADQKLPFCTYIAT